jgi:hypothetical protein
VIPTSINGTHIPPPSTDTENTLTRRQTRRQTQLPTIERSETHLDDDDDDLNVDDRDLAGPSGEDRLSELIEYHKIHGDCDVPKR